MCFSGVSWNHYLYTASSPGSQWNAGLIGVRGVDAASTSTAFYTPLGVAGDVYGNVYVADTLDSLVRKISRNTTSASAPTSGPGAYIISPLAGQVGAYGTCVSGTSGDGGAATSSALVNPVAVAVDVSGNVFFIDCVGPVQVLQGVAATRCLLYSALTPCPFVLAQVTGGTQWGNTVCPHSVVRAVFAAPGPTFAPTRAPTVYPTPTPTAAPSTFKVQYVTAV